MSFLSTLGKVINEQYNFGENSVTNVDTGSGRVPNFGLLGDFSKKIDKSAWRTYIEDGMIRNVRPRMREVILQQPDVTILIKKRMFSSLAENYRLDLSNEDERLFLMASKRLFKNKCKAIAAYELLSKIESIAADTGYVNEHTMPLIFTGISMLDDIGINIVDDKTRTVLQTLRRVHAFSEPSSQTKWLIDEEMPYATALGEGTGVIELTLAASVSTKTGVEFGGGSASLVFEDPYKLLIITSDEIDTAIKDSVSFGAGSFGAFVEVETRRLIEQQKQQLNQSRAARGAARVRFILTPESMISKRVRAMLDTGYLGGPSVVGSENARATPEINFSYNSGFVGIGSSVDLDPVATMGKQGLNPAEAGLFKDIIKNIFLLLGFENTTKQDTITFNKARNYVRRKMRLQFSGKPIIQPMDTINVFMSSKTKVDDALTHGFDTVNTSRGATIANKINSLVRNINTNFGDMTAFFKGEQGDVDAVEKAAIVGAEFPNWLWRLYRNDFTRQGAGTSTFVGLVTSANHSYSSGKYTLSVSCEDNAGYFNKSQINVRPSLDVYNQSLYDPLTPFDVSFDAATGTPITDAATGFPELLPENKAILHSKVARYKNGLLRGQKVDEFTYKTRDGEVVNNSYKGYRQVLSDPDGFVYRWKEGIGSLTKTESAVVQTSVGQESSPLLTADPFAGQDVMNVLSLLLTGQPYNYNCVDFETEALTQRGWVNGLELDKNDILLTKNSETNELEWQPMIDLKLWPNYNGPLIQFKSRTFSAVTTPNHRWLVTNACGKNVCKVSDEISLSGHDKIHRSGVYVGPLESQWTDDFVRLMGWFLTDGTYVTIPHSRDKSKRYEYAKLYQSERANKHKVRMIDDLLNRLQCCVHRGVYKAEGRVTWRLDRATTDVLHNLFPNRTLTPQVMVCLTTAQAKLLIDTMMLGDGNLAGTNKSQRVFTSKTKEAADAFQMLCMLAGYASTSRWRDMSKYTPKSSKMKNVPIMTGVYVITILRRQFIQLQKNQRYDFSDARGVWCPVVKNTYFVARRNGMAYITGNTFIQAAMANANSLISNDQRSNKPSPVTYIEYLTNQLTKRNVMWGNFVPFKKLIMNDAADQFMRSGQSSFIKYNQELNGLVQQRASLVDELAQRASGFAANPQIVSRDVKGQFNPSDSSATIMNQDLKKQIDELSRKIDEIKRRFNDSINKLADQKIDNSILLVGNDVSLSPGVSDAGTEVTEEQRSIDREEFRRRINFLTQRRLWKVKSNNDPNLFIVDDQYDKNFDIQAFSRGLSGQMQLFASEYITVDSKIKEVAALLGLEIFADTQGHIQVRPPQYNRMPSSVFYQMFKDKATTGVQVFPQFMESLFFNQLQGLVNRIEIIEDEIRIRALMLGVVPQSAYDPDPSIAKFLRGSSFNGSGETGFTFISDYYSGRITSLISLVSQSNPELTADMATRVLAPISEKANKAAKSQRIFDAVAREGALARTDYSAAFSQSTENRIFEIANRLERDKGVKAPDRRSLVSDDRLNGRGNPNKFSQLSIVHITNQISTFVAERQKLLPQLVNAIKNLSEGVQLNDKNKGATAALYPMLNRKQGIPQILQHMIEDEDSDDWGPGAGGRFIIKDSRIIEMKIEETPPPYTLVEVNGLFGQGFADSPTSLRITEKGNAIVSAFAVDYDMWRMYGFRAPSTQAAPFFSNPDTQCAPYAVFLLNLARKNILQGSVTVTGNEFYQPGDVVYIEDRDLLFYVTQVSHSFNYGGSFTTTLVLKYGHPPGEYIPTILDIVGSQMYRAKEFSNSYRSNRFGNANGDIPVGVVLFPNMIQGFLSQSDSVQEQLLFGNYGESNRKALNNMLLSTTQVLSPVAFKSSIANGSLKPLLELRIYWNSDLQSEVDSDLYEAANQVKKFLNNPAEFDKGGGTSIIPQSLFEGEIPQSENIKIKAIDVKQDAATGPSSMAWHMARTFADSNGAPTIEIKLSNGVRDDASALDDIMYKHIIEAYITYVKVPETLESTPAGLNQANQAAQEAKAKMDAAAKKSGS